MKYDKYIEKIKIVNWLNNFIYVKEIKLIEGKENNDLEQRKYEILKEKCALQEKEISELKEKLRVGVAEKKNNDFKWLRTERQNIKLLCEIKALKKLSSEKEKELLSRTSEELREMQDKYYLDLKRQKLYYTRTLLEIYR